MYLWSDLCVNHIKRGKKEAKNNAINMYEIDSHSMYVHGMNDWKMTKGS